MNWWFSFAKINWWFSFAKLRFNTFASTRRDFYEDFASSLRDGASAIEQLKAMAKRSRRRRTGWAALYEHWIHKMGRMSFGHALQHTVPPYEAMVLTAAEESGRLEEAMDYLGRSIRLLGKAKSVYFIAMLSPALSFLVIIGFLIAYALHSVPEYLQILPLERWPYLSKVMYHVSTGLVSHGFIISILTIFALVLVTWSKPNWYGRIRRLIEKIPFFPWSSYRAYEGNNFLVALSILLQANNHGLKDALEMMCRFASPWLAWHITVMLHRLKLAPNKPALAMDTGIFSRKVMDRIEDYSDRTEFNSAIYKLAFDSGEKLVEQAQARAVISGLIAMLFVAAMILVITISNIQFAQQVTSVMKSM